MLTTWMLWQGEARRNRSTQEPLPAAQEIAREPASPMAGPLPELIAEPKTPDAVESEDTEPVSGKTIRIERPLYTVELNSKGAGIEFWSLLEYEEGTKDTRRPIVLTTGEAPFAMALVTSFSELDRGDLARA
ncbi:MAG: hypothetical protein OEM05_14825, partial [Myxococcales bacterium]|nr:hypothetical protein [Myxococcales bacterium]